MKNKFWLKFIAVIMVVSMLLVVFVSCNDDENEEPEVLPPTTGEAFGQVVEKLMKSFNINFNEQMYLDFGTDLKLTDKETDKLRLDIEANINTGANGTNENNQFLVELKNTNSETMMGLYADGNYLYINCPNNQYKVNNFKLYELTHGKQNKNTDIIDFASILGDMLFESVEIDGENYIFEYNLNDIIAMVSELLEMIIPEEEFDKIANSFGFESWDYLLYKLPAMYGTLHFNFRGDQITGVDIYNNVEDKKQSINADIIKMGNGMLEQSIVDRLPEGHENFKETKLLNFKANGTIEFVGDKNTVAKYDWEFVSNLDPLELIINGGDFNMDEDDMAHFILKNKTGNNSQEYNDSKIEAKDGVILELAYSPEEFGNKNVMVAVNLKALLPKALLTELGIPNLVTGLIPPYYGAHLDVDLLSNLGNIKPQTPIKDGESLTNMANARALSIGDIFNLVKIFRGGIEIDRELINEVLGDAGSMIMHFLDAGDMKTQSLRLNINHLNFGDQAVGEYQILDHFLYLADENTLSVKDFGKSLGYQPAKEIIPKGNDGFIEFSTKDGKSVNKSDSKAISNIEANGIVGGKISYDYIDFYGNKGTSTAVATIVGVAGLDLNKIGEEQNISLITTLTDGYNLMTLLTAFNVPLEIPGSVIDTKIILTQETSAEFSIQNDREYKIGDVYNTGVTNGKLTVTYQDGSNYVYDAKPIASDVITYKHNLQNKFAQSGDYNLKYIIAGREIDRTVKVKQPDRSEIVLNNVVLGSVGDKFSKNYGNLNHYYGEDVTTISFNQDNITLPKGVVENDIFVTSGNFNAKIKVYGVEQTINVTVMPKVSKYSIALSGTTDNTGVAVNTTSVGNVGIGNISMIVDFYTDLGDGFVKQNDVEITVNGKSLAEFNDKLQLITPPGKSYNLVFGNLGEGQHKASVKLVESNNKVIASGEILY